MANVKFYRLGTLPTFVAENHQGVFIHLTSDVTESDNTIKYKKGLYFGGTIGWEYLTNDPSDFLIDGNTLVRDENGAISVKDDKIDTTFTTTNNVGFLPSGTTINAGTSIESVLRQILSKELKGTTVAVTDGQISPSTSKSTITVKQGDDNVTTGSVKLVGTTLSLSDIDAQPDTNTSGTFTVTAKGYGAYGTNTDETPANGTAVNLANNASASTTISSQRKSNSTKKLTVSFTNYKNSDGTAIAQVEHSATDGSTPEKVDGVTMKVTEGANTVTATNTGYTYTIQPITFTGNVKQYYFAASNMNSYSGKDGDGADMLIKKTITNTTADKTPSDKTETHTVYGVYPILTNGTFIGMDKTYVEDMSTKNFVDSSQQVWGDADQGVNGKKAISQLLNYHTFTTTGLILGFGNTVNNERKHIYTPMNSGIKMVGFGPSAAGTFANTAVDSTFIKKGLVEIDGVKYYDWESENTGANTSVLLILTKE